MTTADSFSARFWRRLWFLTTLLTYALLASYQLGLPGLHYDEAREAGLNAMELLTGAPVTAFRNVTLPLAAFHLPVMVQDYIGAVNVYVALPVLWLSGIGVPNLRIVAVLTGLVALLLVERTVTVCYAGYTGTSNQKHLPISLAGLLAVTLLAASPSFIFWSRQGIFVTNLTQPLTFCCLWQGLRWLQRGQPQTLLISAFMGGCALYAKLLALWIIGPFVLLAGGWWLWQGYQRSWRPALSWRLGMGMFVAFLLPLLPFFFFNWQSGGTWQAFTGHLGTSYYGIENDALFANLGVRSQQLWQMLQGSQFWYLGGLYGNALAPWLALVSLLWGLWRHPRLLAGPLLLLAAAFTCSLVTISDLFITHYALLQPLVISVVALGLATIIGNSGKPHALPYPAHRWLLITITILWILCDLRATLQYHTALTRSGGLADHSDLSYHLAYYLQYNGLGAPIALDWGFDASVRYLSQGAVTPIEIFGYDSPATPDPAFGQRLQLFLDNPNNIYVLHTTEATTFQGRREQFFAAIEQADRQAHLETTFAQRDGTPLVELWRVLPP